MSAPNLTPLEKRQHMRIMILKAELAGAVGTMIAVAEYFEEEGSHEVAAHFQLRAAELRRVAEIKPPGGVQ